jgi:hypothetical protein
MCPARSSDFKKDVCPNCDFKVRFKDERGWVFFVRAGLGLNTFKTFTLKPGKFGEHCCKIRTLDWRNSFQEAQEDLNRVAKERGWEEIK